MKFWRKETKKKANFRRTTQSKSASSESPSQQKISTAYRFSSIKSWVECCSFFLSFPLSFKKQQLSRAYHVFAKVSMGFIVRRVRTLDAGGFSCAICSFGQVLNSCLRPVADETKLPDAREKNLWYPGYVSRTMAYKLAVNRQKLQSISNLSISADLHGIRLLKNFTGAPNDCFL